MEFKKFDWVIWSSQAAGRWKTKIDSSPISIPTEPEKLSAMTFRFHHAKDLKAKPKNVLPAHFSFKALSKS